MDLKLIVAKGDPKGKVISVGKASTVIGRDPGCNVVIASPRVSRRHCQIDLRGDRATLTDLGGCNGTFLNGRKTAKADLKAGDKLAVGPVGLIVQIDGVGAGAATQPAAPPASDLAQFLESLQAGDSVKPVNDDEII